MVVVLKRDAEKEKVDNLTNWLHKQDLKVNEVIGQYQTILGLIGDTSKL